MKRIIVTLIAGAIVFLFIALMPQEEHKHSADDQQRQHIMEMMNDPAMAETIMEHIAENGNLRMKMMLRMHAKMQGDGEAMMEMCEKMMDGDHQHGAMMKHEKMSCCDKESKKEDHSHEKHH